MKRFSTRESGLMIDAGQKLLKQAFGDEIEGLQDLCLTRSLALNVCSGEFVQVLNKGDCHWYTISTIGCQHPATVRVYDSASKYITYRNKEEIVSLLCTPELKENHTSLHECPHSDGRNRLWLVFTR